MTSATLVKRLTIGISGQIVQRIVYAANSIALVPLLIHTWGLTGFGEWLTLTAMTSYFAYSKFGLMTTTVNEIVMAHGAGDRDRAVLAYRMSLNCAVYLILPVLSALVVLASVAPVGSWLGLTTVDRTQITLVIAFQTATIWADAVLGIFAASLYAGGLYGHVYFVSAAVKLLELALIAGGVLFFGCGPVFAAFAMLLATVTQLSALRIYQAAKAPWAEPDLGVFDWSWLRRQLRPGIGFALTNLTTQGVLLQGPRIALGVILGGGAVATYAVYATAMRLTDQAVLLLAYPLEIEIAGSIGRDDRQAAYRLITVGTQFAIAAFLCVAAGLMVFGPLVFGLWIRDAVSFDHRIMALFLLMSAANQIGRISLQSLAATNRLYGPARLMLPAGVAAVLVGAALATHLDIVGMVLGGIAGELIISSIVIVTTTRWLRSSVPAFLSDLLRLPTLTRTILTVARRLRGPSG